MHGLLSPRVGFVVIDRHFNGLIVPQLIQLLDQKIRIKSQGMIIVDGLTLFHRHVSLVIIIGILSNNLDGLSMQLIVDGSANRGLATAGATRYANNDWTFVIIVHAKILLYLSIRNLV